MKSYKREVALGALLWLLALSSYTAYMGTDDVRISLVSLFVLPVLALVGAAFSMDSYFKYDYAKTDSILNYKLQQEQLNVESESNADITRIPQNNDFTRDEEDFNDMVERRNKSIKRLRSKQKVAQNEK